MNDLHENYYHRKCYFARKQVPTQTVMKDKMSSPLANVYFKMMQPKLKVLAGLKPPMKGGGSEWYMPPEDLLAGRSVLKPVKADHLNKLGFNGIDFFGEKFKRDHHKSMEEEKRKVLLESDFNWKVKVALSCRQQSEDTAKEEAKKNTDKIMDAFMEFTTLYSTSITKIESLMFDAAIDEIKEVREAAYAKMMDVYGNLVKRQAKMLYDRYEDKLMEEKARQKEQFMKNVEQMRTDMGDQIHEINVEKHIAIEKLRNLLECQNLACQVYVALKEREECEKEMDISKHIHEKAVKLLKDQIAMKDFEIKLEKDKENKRQEFIKIWKQKICHVIKKFQIFVNYCLNTLPEQAEFFINMEKLMMLQLNEASENPSVENIFEPEKEEFHTPLPRPHPFYLFCDKGYKPQLEQKLCPKHCTSSSSQLPVIIVNKRCIYAACDNFQLYTDKVTQFIHGHRGDDIDFEDDHDYKHNVPVKCTSSQQLLELKLEGSLMQVLQQEIPNIRQVPLDCCVCKIPYCFCSPLHASKISLPAPAYGAPTMLADSPSSSKDVSGKKIEKRSVELDNEREPKWDSYLNYVQPKKCKCAKTAKKHLREHLPAYMRKMSPFESPDLPNYEPCSLATLKKLVKKTRGISSPPPEPPKAESMTRNVCTQYSDIAFENLCECFSEREIIKLFEALVKGSTMFMPENEAKCRIVDGSILPAFLAKTTRSFATHQAHSLKNLLDDAPDLKELFKIPANLIK